MIYLDTSVVLAQLLAEDQRPPDDLWQESLLTSRLLEYELWTGLNARALAGSHGDAARLLLAQLAFVELARPVLTRALEPFPVPVRTLDALHLASAVFVRERGHQLRVATYDDRMRAAAQAMGFEMFEL